MLALDTLEERNGVLSGSWLSSCSSVLLAVWPVNPDVYFKLAIQEFTDCFVLVKFFILKYYKNYPQKDRQSFFWMETRYKLPRVLLLTCD